MYDILFEIIRISSMCMRNFICFSLNLPMNEKILVSLFIATAFSQAHVVFIDRYSLLISVLLYPLVFLSALISYKSFTLKYLSPSLCFLFTLLYFSLNTVDVKMTAWIFPLSLSIFVLLKDYLKVAIFNLFISVLTIVLLFGLSFWMCGFFLNLDFYLGDCYVGDRLFLLYPFYCVEYTPIPFQIFIINRFSSVFDEPGMLGTISALILCAKNFDLKNDYRLFVVLAGGIFSMSLAFFVLCLFYWIISCRIFSKYIIYLFIFFFLFLLFDSIFDGVFVERLSYRLVDSDMESIDNRTAGNFEVMFKQFLNSSALFCGMGHNAHLLAGGGSDGLKVFFYNYGILGLGLLLLSFSVLIYSYKLKWHFMPLIVVYFLSFYQRAAIYRLYQLLIFVAGLIIINMCYYDRKNKIFSSNTSL